MWKVQLEAAASLDVEQDTSAHSRDGRNGLVRGKAVPAQQLQLCQGSLEQIFGQRVFLLSA